MTTFIVDFQAARKDQVRALTQETVTVGQTVLLDDTEGHTASGQALTIGSLVTVRIDWDTWKDEDDI